MKFTELLLFIGIIFFVITLRNIVNNSNSNILKGLYSINELILSIQFTGFIVITLLVFGLAIVGSKHGGSFKLF